VNPVPPYGDVPKRIARDIREFRVDIEVPVLVPDNCDAVRVVLENGEECLFLLDQLLLHGLALGNVAHIGEDKIAFRQRKPGEEYLRIKAVAVFGTSAPALEELVFTGNGFLSEGRLVHDLV